MKVKWAALLNFASALTAIIGVIVGGGVSLLSEEIQMWMLTVAVGMFLYVSLVGMVGGTIVAIIESVIMTG